jgi:AraC-like DNA-binding protein
MSNSGVLRIGKSELNRFAHDQVGYLNCISFGIADGMKSSEFNNELSRHSALKTKSGELWFVTKKGISIVDPENISINKTPPTVVIEQVWFDRQSVAPLSEPKIYKFTGIRNVKFRFTAPTFLSPEKIRFKYQIAGVDKKWVYLPAGKERIALYEDLEPGAHTFKVTACNAEGIWNTNATSFTFTLKSFFYQTLLFKIAVFLFFTVLIAAAVYIYKKRPFDKKINKYKDSSLNEKFAEVCIRRLKHLVEVEKVYRDDHITLQSLADKLSIPSHVLSRILNEKLKKNFSDYINYHRIEEVKEILMSPEGSDKKISAVAYEVGFNALTVFYKAFKKFTGKTPKQYKQDKPTNFLNK